MRRFSSLGHRLRGAALLRRETFDEAVGNTPLIKLQGPSAATGCDIYGKCEFMNPAGSVKDRAALNIFRQADARVARRAFDDDAAPPKFTRRLGLTEDI